MFLHLPHVPCRTEEALGELLREIERHSSSVRYEAMANILAIHSQCEGTCTLYMNMRQCEAYSKQNSEL